MSWESRADAHRTYRYPGFTLHLLTVESFGVRGSVEKRARTLCRHMSPPNIVKMSSFRYSRSSSLRSQDYMYTRAIVVLHTQHTGDTRLQGTGYTNHRMDADEGGA